VSAVEEFDEDDHRWVGHRNPRGAHLMTAPVCFVDTETTGLDPDRHEIWEVGLIEVDGREHHWFLPVDLGRADPYALKIGRFYDRYPKASSLHRLSTFARKFAQLTAGKHLVGAVISFDEERLRKLLKANGACPDWHYHLIDVEALAVGAIAANADPGLVTPPWHSDELTAALGVTVPVEDKHTALGDARWAAAIYHAVMTGPPVPEVTQ
jgi:DNA polymerase III epsilon subunit-like protein